MSYGRQGRFSLTMTMLVSSIIPVLCCWVLSMTHEVSEHSFIVAASCGLHTLLPLKNELGWMTFRSQQEHVWELSTYCWWMADAGCWMLDAGLGMVRLESVCNFTFASRVLATADAIDNSERFKLSWEEVVPVQAWSKVALEVMLARLGSIWTAFISIICVFISSPSLTVENDRDGRSQRISIRTITCFGA